MEKVYRNLRIAYIVTITGFVHFSWNNGIEQFFVGNWLYWILKIFLYWLMPCSYDMVWNCFFLPYPMNQKKSWQLYGRAWNQVLPCPVRAPGL